MSDELVAEPAPAVEGATFFHPAQTYISLYEAYDFFNKELYNGKLPICLLTYSRGKSVLGYFWAAKYASVRTPAKAVLDEIALNPAHFAARTLEDVLSTLVHEMAHLWQQHFGNAPKRAYHNREFADHMESIGLMCSNTGMPGGKKTGQKMTHYIIENGAYQKAYNKLVANGVQVLLFNDEPKNDLYDKPKPKSKVKYSCKSCEANAWAKPNSSLICGDCHEEMVAEDDD